MKKKLTINSLAMGNLKQRRKQYAIMIISIILAMVFSSGMLFFIFSSSETGKAQYREKYGDQTDIISVFGDDGGIYEDGLKAGVLSDYGLAHIIGFGYTNEENLGTAIAWFDDKAKTLSNQSFLEGGYPVNENEIALEQTALIRLGIDAKIGDEITLNVKTQNGAEYNETNEKTYKLVGIVKDKRSNQIHSELNKISFVPAAFVAQGTQTEIGGKERLTGYVISEERYNLGYSVFQAYLMELAVEYDRGFSSASFTESPFDNIFSNEIYVAFVALLLVFASCVAIVNAFNTNLKERKKQIGMFRAVGATKRQIIKIFGREALIISLICTPISMAVSYLFVWGLITLINKEAIVTRSLSVLPVTAAVCVAITMLAAMIPLLSASRITPMQAIRNIENNRKMRIKKIRSKKEFDVSAHLANRNSKFYKGSKIFVSIMLTITIVFSSLCFSYINYKRTNPDSMDHDYRMRLFFAFNCTAYANLPSNGMSEADKRELEAFTCFSKIYSEKNAEVALETDELNDYMISVGNMLFVVQDKGLNNVLAEVGKLKHETLLKDVYNIEADGTINSKDYALLKDLYGFSREAVPVLVTSFEDHVIADIEDKLIAGGIDFDKLNSGEEIILVAPQTVKLAAYIFDGGQSFQIKSFCDNEPVEAGYQVLTEGECPYKVGDKLKLSLIRYQYSIDYDNDPKNYIKEEKEVTIGAIVSPAVISGAWNGDSMLSFVTTHTGMSAFSEIDKYENIGLDVAQNVEFSEETDRAITDFLTPYAEKYGSHLESNYQIRQSRQEDLNNLIATVLAMVMIAFVVCAGIINSSLTASIREKKKEIGTLRAVGADIKTLVKSYVLQLLSMLGIGYGVGFAAFGIAYFAIWQIGTIFMRQYGQVYESEFIFSPWETLAFCAILFAICSINLWSKVRKEMKNSIVENIKEL